MAGQRRESLIDVDREGFMKDLSKALGQIKVKSRTDMVKVAMYAQNRMRELCPVDTGRLRASINGDAVPNSKPGDEIGPGGMLEGDDGDGYYIEIGTNVEYAVYIEFGTSKMRAQPFMRPAMAETAARFGQIMEQTSIAGTAATAGRAKPLFLKGEARGRRVGPPSLGTRRPVPVA